MSLSSKDDCPGIVPAAGNRYESSLNNVGENGNYWSSTPYESGTQNAYNLNFTSGSYNVDWNNRYNGNSVRPVSELTQISVKMARHFSLSKERLLLDIVKAYNCAKHNKKQRRCLLEFEYKLEDNLVKLRDELISME